MPEVCAVPERSLPLPAVIDCSRLRIELFCIEDKEDRFRRSDLMVRITLSIAVQCIESGSFKEPSDIGSEIA